MTDNPDTTWLATAKQRAPVPSVAAEVRTDHPVIGDDLEARARMGAEQYGTRLHCHNGRDALVDAYQEALDLVMYMRQWQMETDSAKGLRLMTEAMADGIRQEIIDAGCADDREDWEAMYTEDN